MNNGELSRLIVDASRTHTSSIRIHGPYGLDSNPNRSGFRSNNMASEASGNGYSTSKLRAAAVGLGATASGLGVSELVASLHRDLRSPVLDVGDRVVDFVPSPVKNIAIDLFGTNDKIALLAGIGMILAGYAAFVGIWAATKGRLFAVAGVGLFATLGVLATVLSRADRPWWAPLPTVLGALLALAVLWVATSKSVSRTLQPESTSRRSFVGQLAGLTAFALGAAALGQTVSKQLTASAAAVRERIGLPKPTVELAPIPQTAQAPGASSFVTPNKDFYRIDTALSIPQVDIESWELRVTGMVDEELTFTYEDLSSLEIIERDITLTCVSNTVGGELIGTARWTGVLLDDLLNQAGVGQDADQIVGRSVDGYTCGFPVAALDGRAAMVAVGMNGESLPPKHGYPARLIVPGIYGYASATKWLTEIEVTRFDQFDHYWVPRGYAVEAPIKMQSRIDSPRGLDRIEPGTFVIGGTAWAQPVGIDRVEVSIDEGEWESAIMADRVNNDTWRQWSLPWEATSGRHSISVRAVDRNGTIQTEDRSEPLPNGSSGLHTVVTLVN